MYKSFLIKYGEIAIKGKNRYLFEEALVKQINYALEPVDGEFKVRRLQGRIYVDALGEYDYDEVVKALSRVFGIVGICPVVLVEDRGFEQLAQDVIAYMDQVYPDKNITFKVNARRARKNYPMNSMELNAALGEKILEAFPEISVDVHKPDVLLSVEIREKINIYSIEIKGAGGMPVGTNGRAIDATIENVHTTASVTVTATTPNAYGCYVGGLVGNIYGTISQSSNAATVTGSGKFIGGIVGVVNGTVSGCYNAGTIKVNGNFTEAGGIIGVNYPSATVTNCYNKGTINGYQNVGGIAGMTHNATGLYLTVSNCYNIGTVTGSKDVSSY